MARLRPDELLPRAEAMADHAVTEIDAHPGDPVHVQDAAGKAWAAARLAAQAVVFCTTRNLPRGTDRLRDALARVAKERRDARVSAFRADLLDAYCDLHLRCGSDGDCSVRSVRRIRSVMESLLPAARDLCAHPP